MPAVTEDIKWEHDLCFLVGGKMFLVAGVDQVPASASFKVAPEEFEEWASRPGFAPAPYLARHHWVRADDLHRLSLREWEQAVGQSYELVKAKLPKKAQKKLNLL